MLVSLNKLLSVKENKYVFSKAVMKTIEKMGNVKDYHLEENEKVVIKALNLVLDDKIKYDLQSNKANKEKEKVKSKNK